MVLFADLLIIKLYNVKEVVGSGPITLIEMVVKDEFWKCGIVDSWKYCL